jgi:nitrogen-specific signal transduction histidine kinase
VGHDITERKEAEAALLRAKEAAEAADRAKSEFLAIVSHELRTPINAIIGFSKMLASTTLTLDQREQVEMVNSSGLALEKIIADILNLSKIDSGKIEIEHAPFSLRMCVQDICAFFAPKARSLALALDSKVDAGVPEILNSDEARIRQILTNLSRSSRARPGASRASSSRSRTPGSAFRRTSSTFCSCLSARSTPRRRAGAEVRGWASSSPSACASSWAARSRSRAGPGRARRSVSRS